MHRFPPRKILVPTDLTGTSEPALRFAGTIHERFGGEVRVLHAHHFDLPPYFTGEQSADLLRELKQSLNGAVEYVRNQSTPLLGFEAEYSVVEEEPAEAILHAAASSDVDLIVMGTHGRHGADRFWLGSVAERVLRRSDKPVLAVRRGMIPRPLERILCPATPSGIGRAALEYAGAMADAAGSRLTVMHAVEPGAAPPDCSLVPDSVRSRCRVEELTYHGDAPGAILTAARETQPDLIVLGAERRTSPLGHIFSSTTERVMRSVQAPLIVVPGTP